MPQSLTKSEKAIYAEFTAAHVWCWACGAPFMAAFCLDDIDFPRHLERHHIVAQPRVVDRRVLALLCHMCHRLVEGATIRTERYGVLPALKLAHVLWLKSRHDGPLDNKFLCAHSIRSRMPRPVQPPVFYRRLYLSRHDEYPMSRRVA